MKKFFYFMLTLACIAIALPSCKEDPIAEPAITLENPVETFLSAGNALTKEVTITSNYDWTATAPESDDWVTIEKVGANKLKITVTPNPTTQSRQSKITITGGYEGNMKTAYITVQQDAGDETVMEVNVEELIFLAAGEAKQLELITNQTIWEGILETAADWVSFEKNEKGFMVTAKENTEGDERSVNMVIKVGVEGNQQEAIVKISQFGTKPTIRFAKEELTVSADGGKFDIEVVTNQSAWEPGERILYEIHAGDWIKLSQEGNKLIIDVEENIALTDRKAGIVVLANKGPEEIKDTLRLVQSADVAATLTMDPHVVYAKNAGTHELAIVTNRKAWDYKITKEATGNWITINKKGNALEIKLTENSGDDRSMEIEVFAGKGTNIVAQTIKITQLGTKTSVYVVPSTITLNNNGDEQKVKVVTNSATWNFEVPSDAKSWLTVTKVNDELSVKATKVEAGSRSAKVKVTVGEGASAAEAILEVKQNKIYKVGDIYEVNGVKLGMVFSVTDGGAHGKVFSLKQMESYPSFMAYRPGEVDTWQTEIYGAVSRTDGRLNENVLKQKEPTEWRTRFPALGWIDKKNQDEGNPGWYWPAIEELAELHIMFAGEKNTDWVISDKSKQNRDRINQLLTDAGGDILVYEDPRPWTQQFLLSSTEEFYQMQPRAWAMYLANYWEVANERASEWDEEPEPGDPFFSEAGAAVRAVLRF